MAALLNLFSNVAHSIQQLILEGFMLLAGYFSGRTRIERIMYQSTGAPSTKIVSIEKALKTHDDEMFRDLAWSSGEETVVAAGLLQGIDDHDQKKDFSKVLARSMRQIKGYTKLCDAVEDRRRIHYDSEEEDHEAKLLKLWELLKPDDKLKSRRCNQWQEIGFQGDDPATDFRGMGILGLEQLVFFAQFDKDNAMKCLKISLHPHIGFPYAVCGITVTALIKELLYEDLLKNHFYNALRTPPTMDNFHQVYCRVFNLYCEFWEHENPSSVMVFNIVKQKFTVHLIEYLRRESANLFEVTLSDIV